MAGVMSTHGSDGVRRWLGWFPDPGTRIMLPGYGWDGSRIWLGWFPDMAGMVPGHGWLGWFPEMAGMVPGDGRDGSRVRLGWFPVVGRNVRGNRDEYYASRLWGGWFS